MRTRQLSFKIDDFSKNEAYTVAGYIDACDVCELLHELLIECGKIYEPTLSSEEFICKVSNYSGSRFGATESL